MQPDWWEVTHPGVGTNRYAYSFNDPVNLSDPNGNVVPVIAALALIGILAADAANAPGPESVMPMFGLCRQANPSPTILAISRAVRGIIKDALEANDQASSG